LEAGVDVLAERGYQAARVDDIVRVANTSHGTFYLYFSNKEDLFATLAADCAEAMKALIGGLGPIDAGDGGRAELRRWLGEFVDTYRRYGAVIRAWMEGQVADRRLVRLGRETFDGVAELLGRRIVAAEAPTAAPLEVSTAALLAMIERFAYFMTSRELPFDDELALDTLAVVVHRGFFGGR
jgi:AcrR family transcriptional regulator